MRLQHFRGPLLWAGIALLLLDASAGQALAQLRVCASVTDLGSLAREIGGDRVSVVVFARGSDDPHHIEAKPSFIRDMAGADVVLHIGMSLEEGWLPLVIRNSNNARVQPNGRGNLNCSQVIQPLEVPTGVIDRSQGDVHPDGNPHYLLDPLNGLRVAALIRNKLSELQPDSADYFRERYDDFAKRLANRLIGAELFKQYPKLDDVPKLALLHEHGKLERFLVSQKQEKLLGGWLGAMAPHYGTKVVDDHSMFPYFAKRFGVIVIGHLEPKPGVPPTTAHLQALGQQMQQQKVRAILANPYFNPRHAQAVASTTGAAVVSIAHQVGSRAGTDDYLAMVDYNVQQLAAALKSSP